ncbi:MAG: MFS transporter [Anaerolineae bacterium]
MSLVGTASGLSARTPRATRRERWAWYLYDFGNSAYAAVVLLAVYAAYFKQTVVGGAEGSRLWGIALAVAMLAVALTSPLLGAVADYTGRKKRFLLLFTALAVGATAALFFVQKGDVALGMGLFILAEFGYRSAQVFYNALLPDIAHPEEIATISGNGWAIGSAGGIICLLIILPLIVLFPGAQTIRISMAITAGFYALAAMPVFLWLPERRQARGLPSGQTYLSIALARLARTLRRARTFREFLKFIASYMVYNGGVLMALNFASIIGAVLFGMDQQELILFVIMVNVTNVFGAWAFGKLARRIGSRQSLIASLTMMVAVIAGMFMAQTVFAFFVVGALAGFAMAGIQSLSRTIVSLLSPEQQSTEFYGFFAVAGQSSAFVGPAVYGFVAAGMAVWYQSEGHVALLAEQMGQRVGILTIGAFLLLGLLVLIFVREGSGGAVAVQAPDDSLAG